MKRELLDLSTAPSGVGAPEAIAAQVRALEAWLHEHGGDYRTEQTHLDDGSRERVYWHYGYLIALKDVLALLQSQTRRN